MTYEEEAMIAQQVLRQLAHSAPLGDAPENVRGAQVELAGVGYSVHRHGNDLRFNQRTHLQHREVGRYLIVAVGEHAGGWVVARVVQPPGGFHDARAAETARAVVERALVQLGYRVGTPGREGRQKTARELDADVRAFLSQPAIAEATTVRSARRGRRRSAR